MSVAAARQASGPKKSQIRSVSALLKPSSAETTTVAASATAIGSPVPSARAAYQPIGSPQTTKNATGEPKTQKTHGRALEMPRS